MQKDPRDGAKTASTPRYAISQLRLLDFDDLYLLTHLLEGHTIAATAKQLGLTQPAITQRVRKIERVFAQQILEKAGRHVRLTLTGRALCLRARDALSLMHDEAAEPSARTLEVAAGSVGLLAWLLPAMLEARLLHRDLVVDARAAAEGELLGLVAGGEVHAALVVGDGTVPGARAHELGEAEHVFVAKPELAAQITSLESLASHPFLDLDASQPLTALMPANVRAQARFRETWRLGSPAAVLTAAQGGFGVTILPLAYVKSALEAGRLAEVLPDVALLPARLRLLYRGHAGLEGPALELAEQLAAVVRTA
jgi:DNA-binding transcriptional LysR family regulator